MAKQIQEILIDDLDGGEANETVSFAIDGSTYEIDLSDLNAKKLRDSLTPFMQDARRAGAVLDAPSWTWRAAGDEPREER